MRWRFSAMSEKVSIEGGLMTVTDIAGALRLNPAHVRDRLVHEAGFPRPVINRPRCRRWSRNSIERWLSNEAAKSAR